MDEVEHVQAYAGTSAPFTFNGLVRHYFLRGQPEQGDLQLNDHRLKPVGSRATVETVFFQLSASGALLNFLFRLEDGGLRPFSGESSQSAGNARTAQRGVAQSGAA
jgi:hypothetical protein